MGHHAPGMTLNELYEAPIEVVIEQILDVNADVSPAVLAPRIVEVLAALGWRIERRVGDTTLSRHGAGIIEK